MTVGDKIRSMTDEELVQSGIISTGKYYGRVPEYTWDDFDKTYYGDYKEGCRQYLKLDISEVDETLEVKRTVRG